MRWRTVLAVALLVGSACSASPRSAPPTSAPDGDPTAGLAVPDGPVLFEPEQLIFPPEVFPLPDAAVARDAPLGAHGWEREFAMASSPDFRWFTVRLHVLEPDVPSSRFVADNDCGSVTWPGERPRIEPVKVPPRSGDDARACVYDFPDGQRVLYYMTGYRNVGIVVGTQPRREAMTDGLALDWLAALARQQIAIIGKVLAAAPPPTLTPSPSATPFAGPEPASTARPTATPLAFEPPVELPAAVGGKPYSFAFRVAPQSGNPPYTFRIGGPGAPIGLALSSTGTLAGTPMVTTDPRVYRFTVCAVDRTSASICREVALKVEVPR